MTGCTNGGKGTHYTGGFGGSPGVLGLQDKPGINVGAGGGAGILCDVNSSLVYYILL